ncbi:MAG TPA: DUF3536 domain-containing protein [Thermoanaerobaculia bacterium]|nr:DUF3536 domain-containing protein [Thermoanaerobaculia bacterium]
MTNHFLCIHGHFYQPPRENPWLDAVELEDSAYPYHDWNERITAECYAANGSSRILDRNDTIEKIVNNYSKISFDFGPTLLSWLETRSPETYRAILDADLASQLQFSGHGSAMAQAYNHMILPLANQRDRRTQVIWGIRDFESRFRRKPEGMWLPETAVDTATLEIVADEGIRFVVLEPHQALRKRSIGEHDWTELQGSEIDPSVPYDVALPSGRKLAAFFYDGPISRAVAFENLLARGEGFAERMAGAFSASRGRAQLVNIATDGETYGHHHRRGDMALAYALDYVEKTGLARLTNYAEFLQLFPPTEQIEVRENTSWSCIHGVERWRSDCGCHTGGAEQWSQRWRGPLRESLDWLRDVIAPLFEQAGQELLADPWAARDRYVDVLLDRSLANVIRFFDENARGPLTPEQRVRVLELMELQRHTMLMYTSCGWFFNDLSGLETVQILEYAGRAIQLAEKLFDRKVEDDFLERLSEARSNIVERGNGRDIYLKSVKPAAVELSRVAAHYAIDSLFRSYPPVSSVYSYEITREVCDVLEAGRARVMVGRVNVVSTVTRESQRFTFGLMYLGDLHLTGGVRIYEAEAHEVLRHALSDPLTVTDFTSVMRILETHLGKLTFSMRTVFHDEQRRILASICNATLSEAEAAFRQLHDRYLPLMRYHVELGVPLPKVLSVAAEFDLNLLLRRALENPDLPIDLIDSLMNKVKMENVVVDRTSLSFALKQNLGMMVESLLEGPENLADIQRLEAAVALAKRLPFEVDLWKVQNAYYGLSRATVPLLVNRSEQGDSFASDWLSTYQRLGEKLAIRTASHGPLVGDRVS